MRRLRIHGPLLARLAAPVAALVVALPSPALAQSCAMCATALANDPLGRAFSWSILFLMATPYVIVGTAGAWLFYMHRRTPRRSRAAVVDLVSGAGGQHPTPPRAPEGDLV